MLTPRTVLPAVILLCCLPTVSAVCGDCNGDGNSSIIDALIAAQHAASLMTLTGSDFISCNVSGTIGAPPAGAVTILDALIIAQYAAGLPVLLKCDEPLWATNCGVQDTDSLPVAPQLNPPDLSIPGSTRFYSLGIVPATATAMTFTLSFGAFIDFDLFVGDVGTVPGDTTVANYAFQERFSSPEVVIIDGTTTPNIGDFIAAGAPVAIAVHLFSGAGSSYTIDFDCTVPIPPSVINVQYGLSRSASTVVSAMPGPDFSVPGSCHWFVLGTFPTSLDHLRIELESTTGDHDLYVGRPGTQALDPYTPVDYPHTSVTPGTTELVTLDQPLLGGYTGGPLVFVVAADTPGDFSVRTWGSGETFCAVPIGEDIPQQTTPVRGALGNVTATRYYRLSGVAATVTEIMIDVTPLSGGGDVDLYVGTTTVGDTSVANYEFISETAGTSVESILIDATTTPPLSSFIGADSAIAVSAFERGDFRMEITCTGGGTIPPPRPVSCGSSTAGQVTTPSGLGSPPALAVPGTTDFYCLSGYPANTETITITVNGAPGDEYVLLVGDPPTPCGSSIPSSYGLVTAQMPSPSESLSICGSPSLEDYMSGAIAIAVHWVQGPSGSYQLEITCDPGPTWCGRQVKCAETKSDVLPQPTQQINPIFTQGADTHFWQLYPPPFGTTQITVRLSSFDPLADYDLFIGGPGTAQCEIDSFAYVYASQNSAPVEEVLILDETTILSFGCNPIPIAVYFYEDDQPYGNYDLQVLCQ